MMLRARWQRWWHVTYHMMRPWTWEACIHREITHTIGKYTIRVRCECGREWT